ncbi:MAG: LysR substrate-binding domain-containing protein [Thalassobaculales bacterium]
MSLDLRQLRAFQAVAEELSFVRAARRLNLAQPALSRTIQGVEEALGVRLFLRTTRTVALTRAGEVLLAETRATLAQMERAERLTREVASGLSGHIDLGYMDFAIHGPMMRIMRRFAGQNPDVRLNMVRRRSDEQSQAVANRRLDAGFTVRHRFSPSVEVFVMSREPLVAVLPHGHRLADRPRLSIADLADEPFIVGERSTWQIFLPEIESFCARAGYAPRIRLEANEGQTLFSFVAMGLGVTLYPECARLAQPPGCAIREFDQDPPLIETFAIHRRDEQDPMIRRLTEMIAAEAIGRAA